MKAEITNTTGRAASDLLGMKLAVMDRRLKRCAQKMKSPRARMLLEIASDFVRKAAIYESHGNTDI